MRRGVIGWLILVIGLLGLNERFFVAWAQGSKSKKAKKGETPTFAMLNASPGEFINKKLTLVGRPRLSNAYQCGYWNAQQTHYSISLEDWNDPAEYIYVYFPKATNKELFELVGRSSVFSYYLEVEVILLPDRFYYAGNVPCPFYVGEGLSWKKVKLSK
jgi:hypothetical protein